MTPTEFSKVLERRIQLIQEVLDKKAKEYTIGGDRLSNFKTGAHLLGLTPEQYCINLSAKHHVSIVDMVNSGDEYTQAQWDEKIGDDINYLILLEALITERREVRSYANK